MDAYMLIGTVLPTILQRQDNCSSVKDETSGTVGQFWFDGWIYPVAAPISGGSFSTA